MSVYQTYEAEKRRLASLNLTPKQYQDAVKQLAKSLGI